MYLTHAALNTPARQLLLRCSNAGIRARIVVIPFAGKHNRCAHDSRVGNLVPRMKVLRRAVPHVLLLLLTLAGSAAVEAQSKTRASDARSAPDPELREILVGVIAEADSFGDRFDAEVWLTDMSRRLARQVADPEERLHILKAVHRQATRAGVEPELVLALIDVESNFDRFAISSATALGLMQVMPFWVPELGYKDKNQLFDIETNILLGCRILKYYLDMERGDLVRGLARYNGSVGKRWYSDRVMDRLRTKWFQH
jgi:soluble lytic murein transglycosylase-like protein